MKRRSSNPMVFRNHTLMQQDLDFIVFGPKIKFQVKLRKGDTYTVYWWPKTDPHRFELYNFRNELIDEGVLSL